MSSSREAARHAYGLSNLHIAVISGRTHDVVDILKSEDGEPAINSRDRDGSTPLMTAVLTGRLSIARILLRNGASAEAKDRRGNTALNYASASLFKRKLRTYRRLGFPPIPDRRREKRALIAKILRFPAALASSRLSGDHELSQSFFYKTGKKLVILKPIATFSLDKKCLERATTGVIASLTNPEVKIAASSGWARNRARGSRVLDNRRYTLLVRRVCQLLGFELTCSMRDNNGKPLPEHGGRFHACHAEKKLAVFWIMATLHVVLKTTDLGRMHELRQAAVPDALKEAIIGLDHGPCPNCWDFLNEVRRVTGISIYLISRPPLLRGSRDTALGCRNCACERCVRRFQAAEKSGRADEDGNQSSLPAGDSQPDAKGTPPEHTGVSDEAAGCTGSEVVGNDIGNPMAQPYGPRIRAMEFEVTHTLSPDDWKVFPSAPDQRPVAKPRTRPVGPDTFQQLLGSNAESSPFHGSQLTSSGISSASSQPIRDPISTVAGRSGYFASPSPHPNPAPEIRPDQIDDESGTENDEPATHVSSARLPSLSPSSIAPSDSSKKRRRKMSETKRSRRSHTTQRPQQSLNLQRFAYSCAAAAAAASSAVPSAPRPRAAASTMVRRRTRWEQQKGAASSTTTARSRTRESARDARLRARSMFARVAQHGQRPGAAGGEVADH